MTLQALSTGFAVSLHLRRVGGSGSSEKSICSRFGLSPAQLSQIIASLQQMGYPVLGPTALRYRLEGEGPFLAEELAYQLGTRTFGKKVEVHDEVVSTNDLARAQALKGACAGTVIFAQYQAKGRGRFGRDWKSARGKNLLFSVLLYPPEPAPLTSLLTIASAVAVAEALMNECALPARIRWPNDVVVEGRKVAGILVETGQNLRGKGIWILGVGVNVNTSPPEVPSATSLAKETGKVVDRVLLARAVLRRIDDRYQEIEAGETDRITERWRQLATILGRRVTLQRAGERFTGRVVHISAVKGVTLQLDGGLFATFPGEQVTLVS